MPLKHSQSIIIANDLRTGRTVYLTEDSRWSDSVVDAELLDQQDYAESRLVTALSGEGANLVIDPYLVGIEPDLCASNIRERIRLSGPTIINNARVGIDQAA